MGTARAAGHRRLDLQPSGPGGVDRSRQSGGVRHSVALDEFRGGPRPREPAVDLRFCAQGDDEADAQAVEEAEVGDDAAEEVFAGDDLCFFVFFCFDFFLLVSLSIFSLPVASLPPPQIFFFSSLYLSGQQDDHGLVSVVGDVRGGGAEVRDEVGVAWRREEVEFFFEVDERGKSEKR